jgi:hypothetical protein
MALASLFGLGGVALALLVWGFGGGLVWALLVWFFGTPGRPPIILRVAKTGGVIFAPRRSFTMEQ